jgi:adenine-specific DNA-methyltransferase
MTIEKLDASTPDLTRQNIERLLELFPECRTEGSREDAPSVDFDLLRQALSDYLVEGPAERYRLDWPGKRQALLTANTPIDKTLRPMREESVDFDTTRNLFIEGDNLDALKLLQETYLGKVKMIYIDPPYNTGNDFVYRDNFRQTRLDYEDESGQRDEGGGRLVANPESNGRFHSNWLNMMFPRLKLARNLLREDGFIFVSIDDNEQDNCIKLCNEILGEEGFVALMVWEGAFKNDARQVGVNHEYIAIYGKSDKNKVQEWKVGKPEADRLLAEGKRLRKLHGEDFKAASKDLQGWFKANKAREVYAHRRFRFIDKNGIYKEDDPTAPGGRKFELINRQTDEVIPLRQGRGWAFDQDTFDTMVADGRVSFITSTSIMIRRYFHETDTVKPQSVFYNPTRSASERLASLMDGAVFDFPKDEGTLASLIEMCAGTNDIVMDFFAGSAAFAHATMLQNATDGGTRPFFVVQLPEEIDENSQAARAGFDDLAQVSRERIRRAGALVAEEYSDSGRPIDIGFRAFRIDSGNLVDTSVAPKEATQEALLGMVSHIKDGRSEEDLLFGALLRWGVDITLPIERRELAGRKVWLVDAPEDGTGKGAALIACFAKPGSSGKGGVDTELADAMAELAPLRVLFRDDGFADDATKENVHSRFKQLAPDTQVRVL